MKTVTVTRDTSFSSTSPICAQYRFAGWGNPAGEVYRLHTGQFLALCNSSSTGYSRKVVKTSGGACKWIEKHLRLELHPWDVIFDTVC